MAGNKELYSLPEVRAAVAALSPEDRELLDAIDPVPFGQYAMKEEQGHFTDHGYISLSGDRWQHDRPLEQEHREPEKKTSIRDRLEQGKKECAGRQTIPQGKGNSEPEL